VWEGCEGHEEVDLKSAPYQKNQQRRRFGIRLNSRIKGNKGLGQEGLQGSKRELTACDSEEKGLASPGLFCLAH